MEDHEILHEPLIPETITPTNAKRLSSESPRLLSFNHTDQLIEASPVLPWEEDGGSFVVVFVNYGLLNIFGLWLHHYQRTQTNNRRPKTLLVFAINEDAYESLTKTLTEEKAHQYLPPNTNAAITLVEGPKMNKDGEISYGKRKPIWLLRIKILAHLLATYPKHDIIVSDIDALWLKDPDTMFDLYDADIVGGKGEFGCDLTEGWKDGNEENTKKRNVLVFGFLLIRNKVAARTLLNKVQESFSNYKNDDQVALNCVLMRRYSRMKQLTLGSNMPSPANITNGEFSETWPDGSVLFRFQQRAQSALKEPTLTAAMLPSTLIRRRGCRKGYKKMMKGREVVAHCFVSFGKTKYYKSYVPENANLLYPYDVDSENSTVTQ